MQYIMVAPDTYKANYKNKSIFPNLKIIVNVKLFKWMFKKEFKEVCPSASFRNK